MTDDIDSKVAWADDQVSRYSANLSKYKRYAEVLEKILQYLKNKYAPDGIVQVREKSVASFAGKIWRKGEILNPVDEFTDLCGGRIITTDLDQIKPVCAAIEELFDIDWDNSTDIDQRLKPTEFGYRSIHYIVSFRKGIFPNPDIPVEIPDVLIGLKAEIQVRTYLEHSWADFSHHITYKHPFELPKSSKREMAKFAAGLEECDCQLIRIKKDLRHFLQDHNAYMTPEEMHNEVRILENVLKHDRDNLNLADEIARLAIEHADWMKAITVLTPYIGRYEEEVRKDTKSQDKKPSATQKFSPILRDYGQALCNQNYEKRKSEGKNLYEEGQEKLREAKKLDPSNITTILALAATYRSMDDGEDFEAKTLYQNAFDLIPDEPEVLSYYLDYAVISHWDHSHAQSMKPIIKSAYRKSRDLSTAGLNIPWSYFNMGKFLLLCNIRNKSTSMYAKACLASRTDWPIQLALRSLYKIKGLGDKYDDYNPIVRFLNLYLHVKYPDVTLKDTYKPSRFFDMARDNLKGPLVIVSGGTSPESEERVFRYKPHIIEGFENFRGTIISGGTFSGVCRLVGDVQESHQDKIRTVCYLPSNMPSELEKDHRYSEKPRYVKGTEFSSLAAVQYWTDIILSGINPSDVRLIGINGGPVAATEFRIAAAFGAKVGIVADSGREAVKILKDPDWKTVPNIIRVSSDKEAIRKFIHEDGSIPIGGDPV